ncbi:MAG TPA: hypothetical protein VF163_08580, partial [Micromonosporaceae bacterium]
MAVIENLSDQPVRLVGIEPVFDSGPGTDMVLGVHLVRRRADEQLSALTRGYPPAGNLVDVRDAVLDPSHAGGAQYQVIIGLQVRPGT